MIDRGVVTPRQCCWGAGTVALSALISTAEVSLLLTLKLGYTSLYPAAPHTPASQAASTGDVTSNTDYVTHQTGGWKRQK